MAVKFDLSTLSLPAGATVTKATLSGYSYDEYVANGIKNLVEITSDWDESTVTWANKPGGSADTIASSDIDTMRIWEDFDVTSVISDVITNNRDHFGFYIQLSTFSYGVYMRSSEYAETLYRPKLTLECEFPNPTIIVNNGGEEWEQNTTQTILWTDNISGNVKIEITENGTVAATIANSVPSNGSYDWQIPEDFTPGTNYIIKVTSVDDPSVFDESDEPVTIIAELIISLPYTQNFDPWDTTDRAMDYWEQSDDDDINWTIQSGPTPSRVGSTPDQTGAEADHTSGSGKYIYVEASTPNYPSKKTCIISPKFNFQNYVDDPKLSLWYHMFSGYDVMGDFYVDIKVDEKEWQEGIIEISGNQGDAWTEKTIELSSFTEKNKRVRFRLRGITSSDASDGWCSDICIDDFRIHNDQSEIYTTIASPSPYDIAYYNSSIRYHIPENNNMHVTITLYNTQGKVINTLVNESQKSGSHLVRINTMKQPLANGVYLCKIKIADFQKTIRIIIR